MTELDKNRNESEVAEREEITGATPTTRERIIFVLVAALVIVIDHLSKLYIENWLPLNHTWAPFPELANYFRITHVSNTGAAFGLFPEGSLVFALIALIVGIVIIIYNYRLPSGHLLLRVALGLQLGGALGNLIDRLRIGHVTDFLDFGPWPVFNVADMAIVSGVIILGFLMIQEEREMRRAAESGQEAQENSEQTKLPSSLQRSQLPPNHEQRTT